MACGRDHPFRFVKTETGRIPFQIEEIDEFPADAILIDNKFLVDNIMDREPAVEAPVFHYAEVLIEIQGNI